jgi:hypothetical protein
MRQNEITARSATILRGWQTSAGHMLARGEPTINIATVRHRAPSGDTNRLCQTCGPVGRVQSISPGGGGVVVVAKYSTEALMRFCGDMLGRNAD